MSDFAGLSDAILNHGTKGIDCRNVNNHSCIVCNSVNDSMVRVGAFIMCHHHWEKEFNVDVIPLNGSLHDKYKEFLTKYQEKYG